MKRFMVAFEIEVEDDEHTAHTVENLIMATLNDCGIVDNILVKETGIANTLE